MSRWNLTKPATGWNLRFDSRHWSTVSTTQHLNPHIKHQPKSQSYVYKYAHFISHLTTRDERQHANTKTENRSSLRHENNIVVTVVSICFKSCHIFNRFQNSCGMRIPYQTSNKPTKLLGDSETRQISRSIFIFFFGGGGYFCQARTNIQSI